MIIPNIRCNIHHFFDGILITNDPFQILQQEFNVFFSCPLTAIHAGIENALDKNVDVEAHE